MTAKDLAVRTNGAAFTEQQLALITSTVAKGATEDELSLFLYTAASRGLDPLLRQIHAVKRWDKQAQRETMAIQVGIDGYRLMADRTGVYAGNDDPSFGPEYSAGSGDRQTMAPTTATVTVWKIVNGVRCPFTATARWSEYYPGDKQGFMWLKMPFLMLGKVAESLALRKAFPAQLSGVYTHEEMAQSGSPDAVTIEAQAVNISTGEILEPAPVQAQRPARVINNASSVRVQPEPEPDDDEGSDLHDAWQEWERLKNTAKTVGASVGAEPPRHATLTQLGQYITAIGKRIGKAQAQADAPS